MDTWLAVASRRVVREYADRDLSEDVVRRILDAGQAGSSPVRSLVAAERTVRKRSSFAA